MDMNIIREYFNNAQYRECIESCLRIIAKNMNNIEAWSLCALSYEYSGRRSEAIECLEEALKIDKLQGGTNAFHISLNLAEFYRRNNMTLQAIALLNGFLSIEDENLHFNLAKCYADLQDYEQSIKHYMMAIKINPTDVNAMFNLANQQAAIGSFKMALKYYALAYEGGMGDAGINLAQIYVNLDQLDLALALYRELEPIYGKDSNFYFNYANALRFHGDFESAKHAYIKALSLHNDTRYAINLAYLFLSLEDFHNGFLFYEYRRALLPPSLSQKFPKHFLDFGFKDKIEILNFIKNKKVALYHEQGFGDSIMFARFIPLLACKEKVLFVPEELTNLFSCFGVEVKHIASGDYDIAIPLPSLAFLVADSLNITQSLQQFRILLLECLQDNPKEQIIMQFLQTESEATDSVQAKSKLLESSQEKHVANHVTLQKVLDSYDLPTDKDSKISIFIQKSPFPKQIKHQVAKTPFAKHTLSKKIKTEAQESIPFPNQALNLQLTTMQSYSRKLKIGLNFSSNPHFQQAREKSIYPQKLLEFLPKEGFQYISLQYEGLDGELAKEHNIIDMCAYIKDFSDSALIIKNLDLVISIDSALAHLSASLGVETLVLLHKKHDWRWGKLGLHESTIWYDKAKLFIQEELHEWNKPLSNLSMYLKQLH